MPQDKGTFLFLEALFKMREDLSQVIKSITEDHINRRFEEQGSNEIAAFTVTPGTHRCDKSPFGYCTYAYIDDPAHDQCIFCGDPEERK